MTAAAQMADEMVTQGYSVCPGALPLSLVQALRDELNTLWRNEVFRAARIGSGTQKQLATEIRSDRIHWWPEHPESEPQQAYHTFLESLRVEINRRTFMGLFDWEGHYAVYPPEAFYRRHVDVFANSPARQMSVITYLNEDWLPKHGGALRLYLDADDLSQHIDIEPTAGTVVVFESARFPHEVLDSHAERRSITGWFRVRTHPH